MRTQLLLAVKATSLTKGPHGLVTQCSRAMGGTAGGAFLGMFSVQLLELLPHPSVQAPTSAPYRWGGCSHDHFSIMKWPRGQAGTAGLTTEWQIFPRVEVGFASWCMFSRFPFPSFGWAMGPVTVLLPWCVSYLLPTIFRLFLTVFFVSRALSSLHSTFICISSVTSQQMGIWAHLINGGNNNI